MTFVIFFEFPQQERPSTHRLCSVNLGERKQTDFPGCFCALIAGQTEKLILSGTEDKERETAKQNKQKQEHLTKNLCLGSTLAHASPLTRDVTEKK